MTDKFLFCIRDNVMKDEFNVTLKMLRNNKAPDLRNCLRKKNSGKNIFFF